MRFKSFTALYVLYCASFFCSSAASAVFPAKEDREPNRYPTVVSCMLTMSKPDPTDDDVFTRLPHSCNDFLVRNVDESQFVEWGCRLAERQQGVAFKFEHFPCKAAHSYASCRVALQEHHSEFVDTFYFLGNDPSQSTEAQELSFRKSCDALGGQFLRRT